MSRDISEVHHTIIGAGTPFVDLHGWGASSRIEMHMFEPIFASVSGWKRYYFDLPGHGQTPAPDWVENSDDILEFALRFIDERVGDQPFAINGSSYGGYLARAIIQRLPGQVLGFCGIVPVTMSEYARPNNQVLVTEDAGLKLLSPEQKPIYENLLVVQSQEVVKEMLSVSDGANLGDEAFRNRIRTSPESYRLSFDVDNLDQPFKKPSLFIMGRQDHWVGYRGAWDFIENFPRATFAILDRSGHAVPIEQKHLFRALVLEWLQRVEESKTD